MGFELDDEKLLLVSGIASAAYAAHAIATPRNFHDTWFEQNQVCNEATNRWFGMALGCCSAQTLVISASDVHQKALKNSLKTMGFCWLTAAGMSAYNASEGIQKRELTYANAAGQAALAALCLWRGYKDDGENEL